MKLLERLSFDPQRIMVKQCFQIAKADKELGKVHEDILVHSVKSCLQDCRSKGLMKDDKMLQYIIDNFDVLFRDHNNWLDRMPSLLRSKGRMYPDIYSEEEVSPSSYRTEDGDEELGGRWGSGTVETEETKMLKDVVIQFVGSCLDASHDCVQPSKCLAVLIEALVYESGKLKNFRQPVSGVKVRDCLRKTQLDSTGGEFYLASVIVQLLVDLQLTNPVHDKTLQNLGRAITNHLDSLSVMQNANLDTKSVMQEEEIKKLKQAHGKNEIIAVSRTVHYLLIARDHILEWKFFYIAAPFVLLFVRILWKFIF